jgi:tetratricopeptide (TPR) repeat protein
VDLSAWLQELRRRRVIRALLAWGLFSFAVLQVVEPVQHALGLADWTLKLAVAVLALGFPATAVLAWAFDLTRHGIERTASVRTAAAPAGTTTIAVADFANQTGEPNLDALSGLLITSLEQSRRLRVLTRGRMLELLREGGRVDVDRIDEAMARQVGAKAGATALLLASIQKLGPSYVVELRALDPLQDHYLFTLREQATSQGEVLPLIDRLSERIRIQLHESGEDVRASGVRVAAAVTPSLEAYRHYFRGKAILSASLDTAGAHEEFQRALAIEPRFAMARYELALVATQMASRDKGIIREAMENVAAAPEKEAGLIRALAAFNQGRFAVASETVEALARRFPDDADVALLATNVGEWVGNFTGAADHAERLQRLHPDYHSSSAECVYLQYMLGRAEAGVTQACGVEEQDRSAGALLVRGLAQALAGDLPGAIVDLRTSSEGNVVAAWLLSQALAANGQVPEALALLGQGGNYFLGLARAMALGYAGRKREGRAAFESAVNNPDADRDQFRVLLSWYLAGAGDSAGVRAVRPERDFSPAVDVLAHFEIGDDARLAALRAEVQPEWESGRILEALLAWRAGRLPEALDRLRAMDRECAWVVPFYRGIAAAQAGLHTEAVEALQRFVRPMLIASDGGMHPWLQARARIQLARSLGELGWRDEARVVIALQLERWKDADADLPLLAEARAVEAELGATDVAGGAAA